jgi:hypothetical protein
MRAALLLLLLYCTAYCHVVYYIHEGWKYTIVIDRENSTIDGRPCPDCDEDGWECEELPPEEDDETPKTGPLQPGMIVIISLTAVLFLLMITTVTAVITYKYTLNKQRRQRARYSTYI